MNLDSTDTDAEPRDGRLDVAMQLLRPESGKRASGLLILTACVGLAVAVMMLAGATVLAPKPSLKSKPAADAPRADFELSSKPSPSQTAAGSEGPR